MIAGAIAKLAREFCGRVVFDPPYHHDPECETAFACGDMSLCASTDVIVIQELSLNSFPPRRMVPLGRVPVLVHGVGVLYRDFFSEEMALQDSSFFDALKRAHNFQDLTESNKPNIALRKGVYLSEVARTAGGNSEVDELHFNLLRCSSNLSGPTLGFEPIDRYIIGAANAAVRSLFSDVAPINHVLAQIYVNSATPAPPRPPRIDVGGGAEVTSKKPSYVWSVLAGFFAALWILICNRVCPSRSPSRNALHSASEPARVMHKASISAHSDKTKDMPSNGVIAFCTFYDSFVGGAFTGKLSRLRRSDSDPFDFGVKGVSSLTRLHFRLKSSVEDPLLVRDFSVTLYPNSMFVIPLSTNRLYTHEIRPSALPIDLIPTRLGYVARCSKTAAVFTGGRTHVVAGRSLSPLVPGTAADIKRLRRQYFLENTTTEVVDYGHVFFSMNGGDYLPPLLPSQGEGLPATTSFE